MDNPRPEKVAVVDEVRQKLGTVNAAILTEYRGLGVQELAALRGSLRDAGGEYRVYKNTLVRLAVSELGLDELQPMLQGPTAIAFVEDDAVTVAKALRDFSRLHPELVVKGGLLGQRVLTTADAAALADVPARPVLLARLAGGLAAPLAQLAGLLNALPRNLAYGLKALVDKGGTGPAPAEAEVVAPPETAQPADTAGTPDTPQND